MSPLFGVDQLDALLQGLDVLVLGLQGLETGVALLLDQETLVRQDVGVYLGEGQSVQLVVSIDLGE